MADKNQQQADKVLRIGIVKAGKVVQERLIRPGQNVTVGESPKNTFVIPTTSLPKRHVLFQARGDRYALQYVDTMKGRVAYRDGIHPLDKLRERGDASRKGGNFVLPLAHKNRGKLVVDDYTILFQFVAAPPESARMVSSHDFRPKLLDDDDPVFLGFLALFSAIATVLMIYVYNTDPIDTVPLEALPDRFVDIVIPSDDTPEEVEVQVEEEAEGEKVKKEEEPKEAEPKEKKPKKELTPEQKAAKKAAEMEKKKENLANKSKLLAGIIGTRGANNSGKQVEDVFADGDAGIQDLQQALQGVGGIDVASEGTMGSRDGTDQGGRGDAGIGDLAQAGGGDWTVGSGPSTKAPTGRANMGSVDTTATGDVADKVREALRKYQGQVKYCYDQRLKENPSINGRIAVDVVVTSGKVSSVSIAENTTDDKQLETCVTGKVRRWRFDSSVTEDIFLPFALSPS